MGDHRETIKQWDKGSQVSVSGFSQFINDTDMQTFAATPSSTGVRLLMKLAILKNFTRGECIPQCLNCTRSADKSTKREHLNTILQQLGFTRLKSNACVLVNARSTINIMAYVDDLLRFYLLLETVLQHNPSYTSFNNTWSSDTQVNSQGQRHWSSLERQMSYKMTEQFTCAQQYYDKILRAYSMDECNPTTTSGNKKPPIAAQPLDKEQHSQYRTAVGQLPWVSQLRDDIAFAVKELYIKGTAHYNVILAPKAEHNEQGQINVHIESSVGSDWAGCNTTLKKKEHKWNIHNML
eukprot:1262900-Amphidinium_carterae.2